MLPVVIYYHFTPIPSPPAPRLAGERSKRVLEYFLAAKPPKNTPKPLIPSSLGKGSRGMEKILDK
jgi:hypothetical protein